MIFSRYELKAEIYLFPTLIEKADNYPVTLSTILKDGLHVTENARKLATAKGTLSLTIGYSFINRTGTRICDAKITENYVRFPVLPYNYANAF